MKAPVIDGIKVTKSEVHQLRGKLILLRNEALNKGDMESAVNLSVTLAFLSYAIEQLEE